MVQVPGGDERARRVELSVQYTCDDDAEPLRSVVWSGEESAPIGALDPGTYSLSARAWEEGCLLYATGCERFGLEAGGSGTLRLVLEELAYPVGCSPWETCEEDECKRPADGCPTDEPLVVSTLDTPDQGLGVAVSGSHVLVAAGIAGLLVVDASDRQRPEIVRTIATPHDAVAVVLSDPYAFVATGDEGLQVVDVSAPSEAVLVGGIPTNGFVRAVAVRESRAFVGMEPGGLAVYDVSTPTSSVELGSIEFEGNPLDVVALADGYVLVSTTIGVAVLRVSDDGAPALVRWAEPQISAHGAFVSGTVAYVTGAEDGLFVFDVRDPEDITLLSSFDTADYARDVAVAGDRAFVADGTAGLVVLDVSDPTSARQVAAVELAGPAVGVAVHASTAFVATHDEGIAIVALDCDGAE